MRRGLWWRGCLGVVVWLVLLGADKSDSYHWNKPEWVPDPVVPADNPMSEAKVELGRHLFYDKQLSLDNTKACASCHLQDKAFTDGRALPLGIHDTQGVRSAMMLANVAYLPVLTWANPNQKYLERQLLLPLFGISPVELGMEGKEQVLFARLGADVRYPEMFKQAFPEEQGVINLSTVSKAIASFERALLSFNSPYDRYKYGRQPEAISPAAKRGEALFYGEEMECAHCHGGFNFTDNIQHRRLPFPEIGFHNTGMYNLDGKGAYPADNHGIREVTDDPADEGKFRTPTLRNIAVTAPYMHDGSLPTLRDVIRKHYAVKGKAVSDGKEASPLRDTFIEGFAVTDAQLDDLVAFLEALTDKDFLTNPKFSDPFATSSVTR
ncbi:methanobactin export MATE transporter MbnM [Thiothrix sp.]|uniref:methanobactin export MATE transporter MbnM n=1 Tax=Thiothrix sp. TaxID=1032 RepID=UPI00257BD0BE|nr:methanobactin export MATE transporter MbnM [Thiothrix sp.]